MSLDLGRANRTKFRAQSGELAYASVRRLGDDSTELKAAAEWLLESQAAVALLRHVTPIQSRMLLRRHPRATYYARSGLMVLRATDVQLPGRVVVVSAGTTDRPVAEEAEATAQALGCEISSITDAGVAGLQRILRHGREIREAECLIVAAGMEGALPAIVTRMADCPVIGLPTSVGYGASFGGTAAMLGMTYGDAPGLSVVGIDDGVAAGAFAYRILKGLYKQATKKVSTRS